MRFFPLALASSLKRELLNTISNDSFPSFCISMQRYNKISFLKPGSGKKLFSALSEKLYFSSWMEKRKSQNGGRKGRRLCLSPPWREIKEKNFFSSEKRQHAHCLIGLKKSVKRPIVSPPSTLPFTSLLFCIPTISQRVETARRANQTLEVGAKFSLGISRSIGVVKSFYRLQDGFHLADIWGPGSWKSCWPFSSKRNFPTFSVSLPLPVLALPPKGRKLDHVFSTSRERKEMRRKKERKFLRPLICQPGERGVRGRKEME